MYMMQTSLKANGISALFVFSLPLLFWPDSHPTGQFVETKTLVP